MKKISKIFLLILFSFCLISNSTNEVFAEEKNSNGFIVEEEIATEKESAEIYQKGIQTFYSVTSVINIFLLLIFILSCLFFGVALFLYYIAAGNEKFLTYGRNLYLGSFIGLTTSLTSYVIINIIKYYFL